MQEIVLVALHLKVPPRLGKLCGKPSGNALGLQPLGHRGSELGLEAANPLLLLVVFSDCLVVLLAGHATL